MNQYYHTIQKQNTTSALELKDDTKKRTHHIGDFLPHNELQRFEASIQAVKIPLIHEQGSENILNVTSQNRIDESNIGHKLLRKYGWKEGEGLGLDGSGRAEPIIAGDVKLDTLGIGVEKPGEISQDDDKYEVYRKRMMLAYRFRPNPLNNPRKPYY